MDPLAQLKDIHLPQAIPNYPMALGWWLLALIILLLVILTAIKIRQAIIKGKVKKLSDNKNHILPNVGWFETSIKNNQAFGYLKKFDKQKFYYVHSYIAEPIDKKNQVASSLYNGNNFCAMTVKNSNIIGTQFHPEKSSEIGLELLDMLIKNSIN